MPQLLRAPGLMWDNRDEQCRSEKNCLPFYQLPLRNQQTFSPPKQTVFYTTATKAILSENYQRAFKGFLRDIKMRTRVKNPEDFSKG